MNLWINVFNVDMNLVLKRDLKVVDTWNVSNVIQDIDLNLIFGDVFIYLLYFLSCGGCGYL